MLRNTVPDFTPVVNRKSKPPCPSGASAIPACYLFGVKFAHNEITNRPRCSQSVVDASRNDARTSTCGIFPRQKHRQRAHHGSQIRYKRRVVSHPPRRYAAGESPGCRRGLAPTQSRTTDRGNPKLLLTRSRNRCGCSPNSTGGNSGNDKLKEGPYCWRSACRFARRYHHNDSGVQPSLRHALRGPVGPEARRLQGEGKARLQGSELLQGQGRM